MPPRARSKAADEQPATPVEQTEATGELQPTPAVDESAAVNESAHMSSPGNFLADLKAGRNPFASYPVEVLHEALATALDELHRLNYEPETGKATLDPDSPCATCWPGGWGNSFAEKQTNISCEHGTWNRPAEE